jgi:hypothetical protein
MLLLLLILVQVMNFIPSMAFCINSLKHWPEFNHQKKISQKVWTFGHLDWYLQGCVWIWQIQSTNNNFQVFSVMNLLYFYRVSTKACQLFQSLLELVCSCLSTDPINRPKTAQVFSMLQHLDHRFSLSTEDGCNEHMKHLQGTFNSKWSSPFINLQQHSMKISSEPTVKTYILFAWHIH